MRTNWTTTVKGDEFASAEEYGAAVDAAERLKREAEPAFRKALAAGFVLVEHWVIGSAPSHVVWTGAEYLNRADGHTTAAHVASRFRAGWTRVEVMSKADAKRIGNG